MRHGERQRHDEEQRGDAETGLHRCQRCQRPESGAGAPRKIETARAEPHQHCGARKVWVWLVLTDKWLVILTTPASMAIGSAQLIQKLSRRDQIGGAETLRQAVVDRLEAGGGVGGAALMP
jgi:hypothetical protein